MSPLQALGVANSTACERVEGTLNNAMVAEFATLPEASFTDYSLLKEIQMSRLTVQTR
jgi:hypothetical protein